MNPEKVILVCLQKLTLRRTILKGDDLKLSDIPQSEASASQKKNEPVTEVKAIKIPEVAQEVTPEIGPDPIPVAQKVIKPSSVVPAGPKSWIGFLNFLKETSPATATNLEHGNILDESNLAQIPLELKVAFPEEASVFKDFLEEKEIHARLKAVALEYFGVKEDQFIFRLLVINNEEKEATNFRTKVELDDEHRASIVEDRRSKIFNDPFVKEAEKLFNAKIDKVVLKD